MSADPPLVSVVIPTFNYGHYVSDAVDSALAQTYPAVEVIVVDDGSTDDTRERLAPYQDRIRYIYQNNAGLSAARNTGIRAARGAFVAFLDSDDAFHPRKLELQMGLFQVEPTLGLVATQSNSDDPRVWIDLPSGPLSYTVVTLEDKIICTRFSPSSVVARRECFERVGDFDTTLRSVEDRDMWIRIAARCAVKRIDLPLTWYRQTPGSMSRNPERMEHFERVVLDKAFKMPELVGRWALRRKAFGLADLASCFVYRESGRSWIALKRILRSFIWWPLPYRKSEMHVTWVRPRLLLGVVRRAMFGRPVGGMT